MLKEDIIPFDTEIGLNGYHGQFGYNPQTQNKCQYMWEPVEIIRLTASNPAFMLFWELNDYIAPNILAKTLKEKTNGKSILNSN